MKRIGYILLFPLLLASCGPSHPLNAVRVQYEDSKWHDYYILEHRDTSIVAYANPQRKDLSEVLPLGKMQKIAFQGKTTAGQWIGGIGALFIATSVVYVNNPIASYIYLASIPIGVFIGHWITDRWLEEDPYSLETREMLESRSEYFERK